MGFGLSRWPRLVLTSARAFGGFSGHQLHVEILLVGPVASGLTVTSGPVASSLPFASGLCGNKEREKREIESEPTRWIQSPTPSLQIPYAPTVFWPDEKQNSVTH